MVDPSAKLNWNDRRGGCPITTRAEWSEIKLGLQASMQRAIEAAQAVMRVTGETFDQAQARLLVRHPFEAGERRIMMDLWRKDAGRNAGSAPAQRRSNNAPPIRPPSQRSARP